MEVFKIGGSNHLALTRPPASSSWCCRYCLRCCRWHMGLFGLGANPPPLPSSRALPLPSTGQLGESVTQKNNFGRNIYFELFVRKLMSDFIYALCCIAVNLNPWCGLI